MSEGQIVVVKVNKTTGEVELEIDDTLYKELKKRADKRGMSVDEFANKIIKWEIKRGEGVGERG